MGPALWLFVKYTPGFSDGAYNAMITRYGRHCAHAVYYACEIRNVIESREACNVRPPGAWPLFGTPPEDMRDNVRQGGGNRLAECTERELAESSWFTRDGTPYARRSLEVIEYDWSAEWKPLGVPG